MTLAQWFLLIGFLLLARGFSPSFLGRLPITSSIVYLAAGIVLGPSVLNIFYFDPIEEAGLLEHLTEVAVLISLFSAGVKMPVPIMLSRWRPPLLLAWASMTITVTLVAAFSYLVLDLPLGAGVLLGAVLAPTDPVLATDVQTRYPGDKDQLRFTLTSEAGMNDGTAFPFVMLGLGLLGLHELGDFGWRWLVFDVLWATLAAIAIGILCGMAIAHAGWKLRGKEARNDILDDLVGLGLIASAYGLCLVVDAWGFLAVFFSGVALRHSELHLATRDGVKPERLNVDAADEAEAEHASGGAAPTIVSNEALVFKEHLERLSELTLVLLLGGMMFIEFWNARTVGLAMFVLLLARPVSVLLVLIGTRTSMRIRGLAAWFGVRGIGSVYYLMYAIQHGLPEHLARELIPLTLIVITVSIIVHGTSVKPLMHRFLRRRKRERRGR